MKKFVSWLGGIAATVIAGWLVYKLTTPTPQPPEPTPMVFEGMVIDKDRNVPVRDARVAFEVNGASEADAYHDLTDANGSYGIKLSGLASSSKVRVHVQANGYHDESKQFTSLTGDNRYDPLLIALPTPPPPHGATPTPTPPVVQLRYIPKAGLQTIRIFPPALKK